MNILFIFTGGTIGSTTSNRMISLDNSKRNILLDKYGKLYGTDFDYTSVMPYSTLSENSTGETLEKLCRCVNENLNKGYDGIIVTHGTDTLQYSAAALAYSVGNSSIPVCIVSSNYTIEDSRSNGIANLRGAIEFIRRGSEKGVWVSYQNTGDFIRIHRASRLLASNAFTDDVFSAKNSFYGYFDNGMNFVKNPDYVEYDDEIKPFSVNKLGERCNGIIRTEHCVGMQYPCLNDSVRYVLIGSYHSGTVDTDSESAKKFYEEAHEKGVTVFITGVYGGDYYESETRFKELNINPIMNISPVSAYIKLWMCLANGIDAKEAINKSLGGDKW